jgi:hypothetical protein
VIKVSLLWNWWGQIWPNLAASAITTGPMFITHHLLLRAHITATAAAKTAPEQIAAVPDARAGDTTGVATP